MTIRQTVGDLAFVALLAAIASGTLVVAWFLLAILPVQLATERTCLRHGFPEVNVTITLDRYCIRRVNQTDSVVAVSALPRT